MVTKHRGRISALAQAVAGFAVDVVYDRRTGLWAALLAAFLRVLAFIFRGLVALRLWLYRERIFHDTPLGCKVVVVGNLTVGGTGKTPVVMRMARVLSARGRKVAILSRGYKGRSDSLTRRFWRWLTQGRRPDPLVVSDGKTVLADPEEAGDEPYMMARNLLDTGVVVIVDRNRVEGGRFALRQFGVDTILLDDGLQYLPLRGQVNLLLVDRHNPFGNRQMLPRGILREPVANLSRGTFIFVTKCEDGVPPELEAEIRKHNPRAEIIACAHRPNEIAEVDGPRRYPLDWLKGRNVMAFSGIATPDRFEATLRELGANLVAHRRFLDHHAFAAEDLDEILERAYRSKAEVIVTTEKDAVRLQASFRPPLPLVYIRLDIDILGDPASFNAVVDRICSGAGRA